jgi:hypothetical protein
MDFGDFVIWLKYLIFLSHLLSITHAHFMRKRVSYWLRVRVLSEEEEKDKEKSFWNFGLVVINCSDQ